MEQPIVLTYGISYDKVRFKWIVVEATKYDDETNKPISWGIRNGSLIMSKITGDFEYETSPSNRDEDFLKEFRFDTPEEAFECWKKFNK